jgi:alanyl aminopeptidase
MVAILEDYLGIPYPYQKLDLIAVAEMKSGGMENVAAIIYRESLVLFGDHPSIYQERGYAYVHAHELAHQWFGNLVTPAWWDDLWLNESFATWMSDRVVHVWRPNEFDNRSPIHRAHWAMRTDRLVSSRQIRQPIVSNHDISSAFDSITYSKGGAVLAMFERFMGDEAFRAGIRIFLKRFAYGTATSEDFIRALSEGAGDERLVEAFRSFVEQPGTPLLEVDWSCGSGDVQVDVKQSRYLPLGSMGSPDRRWQIPLCLVYEQNGGRERHCFLLTEPRQQTRLAAGHCPRWIMPNEAGAGHYNWALQPAALTSLIDSTGQLEDREFLSLVGSLSAAYNAGLVDVETYLQVARAAAQSQSWDIAQAPMQGLRDIKNFILPEADQEAAKAVYRQFYGPALSRVGLSDTSQQDGERNPNAALLRNELIWFLALDADEPVLRKQLSELGQAYVGYGTDGMLHPDVLNPDLVRASLIVATQELGAPFFDALAAHLERTKDSVLRNHIIRTLAYQTDPELIDKVRALIVGGTLNKQETSRLIYDQSRRVANRDTVWRWATAHFDDILTRIPHSHQGGLPWLASAFCTLERRDSVRAFFEPRIESLQGGPRTLAKVLESIELCAAVADRQRAGAVAYFGKH